MSQAFALALLVALTGCPSILGFSEPTELRDDADVDARVAGPPAALRFKQQPTVSAAGTLILPSVQVEIVDNQGLLTDSNEVVSISLVANPTSTTLHGKLNVLANNGIATFGDLRIDTAGTGYQLRATSGTLTSADSTTFDVGSLFSAAQIINVTTDPRGIRIKDLDGDGQPDIAVSHRLNELQIRFGNPATPRTFASPTTVDLGTIPNFGLEVGDMNHDGRLDLVVNTKVEGQGQIGDIRASLQSTSTARSFSPPVAIVEDLAGTYLPHVRDLNNDGYDDVAVMNSSASSHLLVALQSTSTPGTFAVDDYSVGLAYCSYIATGDLTGDGRLDIYFAAQGAGATAYWYQIATDGKFAQGSGHAGNAAVAVVDIKGDNAPDMVSTDGNNIYTGQQEPSAIGTFTDSSGLAAGPGALTLGSGDWNRDGKIDLVVGYDSGISTFIQDPTAAGTFLARQNFTGGGAVAGLDVADIDLDGKLDVATVTTAGKLVIYWGQ